MSPAAKTPGTLVVNAVNFWRQDHCALMACEHLPEHLLEASPAGGFRGDAEPLLKLASAQCLHDVLTT